VEDPKSGKSDEEQKKKEKPKIGRYAAGNKGVTIQLVLPFILAV
jgi:hypothetical protein